MSLINVHVKKGEKDNSSSLLKKFTQKIRSSGVVQKAKSIRFQERPLSKYKKKMEKLRKLKRQEEMERLEKLGKKLR